MVLVVVVCCLLLRFSSADILTTLDDVFVEWSGLGMDDWLVGMLLESRIDRNGASVNFYSSPTLETLPRTKNLDAMANILEYLHYLRREMVFGFETDLKNVKVKSLYDDLNGHCSHVLETPISDLTRTLDNMTCVKTRLVESLIRRSQKVINVVTDLVSGRCIRNEVPTCWRKKFNCSLVYGERVRKALNRLVQDFFHLAPVGGKTPLEVIQVFVSKFVKLVSQPYITAHRSLSSMARLISSTPSQEPFSSKNIINFMNTNIVSDELEYRPKFQDELMRENGQSSSDNLSRNSDQQLIGRNIMSMMKSNYELMSCVTSDLISKPLTWSKISPVYSFYSQCLCIVSTGNDCDLKAPQGVDPRSYCLSMLRRDLQNQVRHRPAVINLDYASQARLSSCQFSSVVSLASRTICDIREIKGRVDVIKSVRCYFKRLVNKDLNCSKSIPVDTFNQTELCAAVLFAQFVLCDDDDKGFGVSFNAVDESTLAQFLMGLDVAVRVITLISYLACSQLRNNPGKLLTIYQWTELMRLAVRRPDIDIFVDLGSTLWLMGHLHIYTVLVRKLCSLESLNRCEGRMLLFCYVLLGFAVPLALAAAVYNMDDVVVLNVQLSQLIFVICNFVILLFNLFMFLKVCKFYYALKSDVDSNGILAGLLSNTTKAFFLSVVVITSRLVLDPVDVSRYHKLSRSFHSSFLFAFFGCSREARAFWFSVVSTLCCFPCWRNSGQHSHTMELVHVPDPEGCNSPTDVISRKTFLAVFYVIKASAIVQQLMEHTKSYLNTCRDKSKQKLLVLIMNLNRTENRPQIGEVTIFDETDK